MPDAIASTGRAADPPIRTCSVPSAADLAVLVAEFEEADRARMRAERRYACAADVLGRTLVAIGPRVLGLYSYRGFSSVLAGGTPRGVVFRELAAGAGPDRGEPAAAHACIAIDPDLLEGDAD
jgi:hypothetical protein